MSSQGGTAISEPLTIDKECSVMSLGLGFSLTTWESKRLVGSLAAMAIVNFVTCMICKMRNIPFSFA
eukprot:1155525-Pelagomonas_calceolata.AAC.1